MDLPAVSVVIPTLNAERSFDDCLAALRAQDWPRERLEILVVDAGSTDRTLEIAGRHGVDRILDNPLRTGEAGKAVGIRAAAGELVVLVDSDNVVVGRDWLRRMTAPFADPDVMGAEVRHWHYDPAAGTINRWHALSGVADPLTLYSGNYARQSLISGTWTGLPHEAEPRDGWTRITLRPGAVPVLGANGFAVRRRAFDVLPVGEYHFDLDFVHELVLRGHRTYALVDCAIEHRFCADVRGFVRKTRRRADDFFAFRAEGARSYPWERSLKGAILRFIASTVLLAPVLADAARGWRRRRDVAWAFHPVACWLTLGIYATATVRARIAPRVLDRSDWRQ